MRPILLASAVALSLAACTTSPTGKSVVSAPKAGSYLTQASAIIGLAVALDETSPTPHPAIEATLTTAATALSAVGADLSASGATSGDATANVQLAYTAIGSLIGGAKTVNPKAAAKAQGYLDALVAAVKLYNSEAPATGLPVLPLPAVAT